MKQKEVLSKKERLFKEYQTLSKVEKEACRRDLLTWSKVYRRIKDERMEFVKHNYLVDIYRDTSKVMVIQKAAQCGISEYLINLSFYLTEVFEMNGLYCFPAQRELNDFAKGRVDPAILQSPHLKSIVKGVDNVGMKQIKNSFIYFRGSRELTQITSIDADYIFFDELDFMNQENISITLKRKGHSLYGLERYVSTPTEKGFGINALYENSDKKIREIQCLSCKIWLPLDFLKLVRVKHNQVGMFCECGAKLTYENPQRWRALKPNNLVSGYQFGKLIYPLVDLKKLWKDYTKAKNTGHFELRTFFNFELGLPYKGEEHRLGKTDLQACIRDYRFIEEAKDKNVFIGIDIGIQIYFWIGEVQDYGSPMKVLFVGKTKDFNYLTTLMKNFEVKFGVIDAQPETRESAAFQKEFPGRVSLAYYSESSFKNKMYIYDRKTAITNIDRDLSLDYLLFDIKRQRITLPVDVDFMDEFFEHFKNIDKVTIKDKQGNLITRYDSLGPDHFMHAANYCRVAADIFFRRFISEETEYDELNV